MVEGEKLQEEGASGSFTFLHLLIIFQELIIIDYIVENHKDLLSVEFEKKVEIPLKPTLHYTTDLRQGNWIIDANCIHLAAKFTPEVLNLILSKLKSQDLINKGNHYGSTPLHLSSKNSDSFCTR